MYMANKTEKQSVATEDKDPDDDISLPVQRLRHETYDTFTLELKPARDFELTPFRPASSTCSTSSGGRGADFDQRRSRQPREADPHHPRGRRGHQGDAQASPRATSSACAALTAPPGRSKTRRARMCVIIAGGIGLAPLRPSIYHILANRDQYGKVILLYGTRTPEDILFMRDLEQWRAPLRSRVFITVDRATGDWRGNVGVVTTLIPKAPFDPHNTRRDGRRPGDHDALHDHGTAEARPGRPRISISPWSAT